MAGDLNTDEAFHTVAIGENAAKFWLPFDSYLIAIEKAGRRKVGFIPYQNCRTGERYCFGLQSPYFRGEPQKERLHKWIARRFSDPKSHFVSHIVRYNQNSPSVRFVYNIYSDDGSVNGQAASGSERMNYVRRGWDALVDGFASDLRDRIEQRKATHVFVYSTGWNTEQKESIKNYEDWFHILMDVNNACVDNGAQTGREGWEGIAPGALRPIFIGLSWSSNWPNVPLPGVFDFVNKGHDADEVGLTWANLLVNKVVKEIAKEHDTRIVLVGHSFGARLLSRATHSAPLVLPNYDDSEENRPIDLFIGLQGAFPYKRFVAGEGREGSPYADFALRARKFLFTTSANDGAVNKQLFSVYIGGDTAFAKTRKVQHVFEHGRLLADDGRWEHPPSIDEGQIGLLDASAVVSHHNDVYNRPIARFVLQALSRYAPGPRTEGAR